MTRARRYDLKDPRQVLAALDHARALERSGRGDEAGHVYLGLGRVRKAPPAFYQSLGEGLSRTGHKGEADRLYRRTLAARSKALPTTLDEALDTPDTRLEAQRPDPRALDWAWRHRSDSAIDRATFERRARWGMAADALLLDWRECRPDDRSARSLFINGDAFARGLQSASDGARGLVMASAHFGAVFAPPLIYNLYDSPVRAIAAFSSYKSSPLSSRMLSTVDLDRKELARQADAIVADGGILTMAVDGSLGGKPIDFGPDGLPDVRVSPLLARLAHRYRCPSVFRSALWEDRRTRFHVEPLPDARPDETFDAYFDRWASAYRDAVARHLEGASPENLRLNSGIWRGIKRLGTVGQHSTSPSSTPPEVAIPRPTRP